MNESAQQAISVGINAMIFIIALTISLNLIFAVRDLADIAKEVNDSVPDGSKTEALQDYNERIVDGYEVVSYYMNYIKPYIGDGAERVYNHPKISIEIDKDGNGSVDYRKGTSNLSLREISNQIDLKANYRLKIDKYNEENDITTLFIQKVI